MYQIVSIDMQDETVTEAVHAVMNGTQNIVPKSNGQVELITENSDTKSGNGDSGSVLVIVGHGSPNGVSGCATWKLYSAKLSKQPDSPTTVYVVACSTANKGQIFAYGNFAQSVKDSFPKSTVWASKHAVDVPSLAGEWIKL